jgi:hypothetical protein
VIVRSVKAVSVPCLDQRAAVAGEEVRGDGLAERRGMDGRAAADAVGDAHRAQRLALVDVEDLAPVEHAKPHGLLRQVAQPDELGFGRAAEVELVPDPVGELERAGAEAIALVARVEPDVAFVDQRLEDAVQRALVEAGLIEQRREPRRARGRGDDVDDGKAPDKRLHPRLRGAGGLVLLALGELIHLSFPPPSNLRVAPERVV